MWRRPHGFMVRIRRSFCSGRFFQAERILRDAHQLGKQTIALQRQQREHLAIDFDPSLAQPIDETAVGHAELASEGIDPRNPEGAIIALVLFAIAIGVGQALFESIAGLLIKSASSDETGGELELSFMAAA